MIHVGRECGYKQDILPEGYLYGNEGDLAESFEDLCCDCEIVDYSIKDMLQGAFYASKFN